MDSNQSDEGFSSSPQLPTILEARGGTQAGGRASENYIAGTQPNLLPQRTFRGGIEASYGTPGGVRPDFVSPDGITSVEVKNYDIANNAAGLVRNVADQGFFRAQELPPGMT